MIVANIVTALMVHKRQTGASWLPMPGIGTRVPVSPRSLPQPDVFVKETPTTGSPVTDDALVLFEVLSRSNTRADQAWRRTIYASVPNCRHYVTVSLRAVEVDAYDRDTSWKKRAVTGLGDVLSLPALDLSIPLADVYMWTSLARSEK
jgi:Uma2 family endonuclease